MKAYISTLSSIYGTLLFKMTQLIILDHLSDLNLVDFDSYDLIIFRFP